MDVRYPRIRIFYGRPLWGQDGGRPAAGWDAGHL